MIRYDTVRGPREVAVMTSGTFGLVAVSVSVRGDGHVAGVEGRPYAAIRRNARAGSLMGHANDG